MISLSVKYRPTKFNDVSSQTSIIRILSRQIDTNTFKNSYLFCGSSGCGKTTIARILANEINKHQGNPIEIDAASNNGVDNVKQIIKSASERSLDSEYKIYIIDECHALTSQAWQAFLKCIEEPPKYTVFIFCTTEKNKVPDTIKNRCQVFNFNRIPSELIRLRLEYICKQEGFLNYEDACDYISRICKNQMRDGISLLEQCAAYDINLNIENVLKVLGSYSYTVYFKLINSLIDGNLDSIVNIINTIYNDGIDLKLFVDQFLSFILDISKYIICNNLTVTKFPSNQLEEIKKATNFENPLQYYQYIMNKLIILKNDIKNDTDIKSTVDVYFIQMGSYQ
ncbi:MAG: DNA polymerase III subunit gamma/tau [Acholeplasmatales bacterium]|nr:DNA polymerase III subunit gamma/tau [Methanobrevibacter sp.]MBP5445473.1 DNA polymerase III subunit gamma/tau [Acholeplasmatales bacterium]